MTQDQQRIASREGVYQGIKFRSHLEIRWAVIFDRLKWRWTYETLSLGDRIPDFVMQFAHPSLLEVKPAFTHGEMARERMTLVCRAAEWLSVDAEARLRELDDAPEAEDPIARRADLMEIDDLVRFLEMVRLGDNSRWARGRRALVAGGQLFEPMGPWSHLTDAVTLDGLHLFARCPGCPEVGLFNQRGCLVCGRDDARPEPVPSVDMQALWAHAGNVSRWEPKPA